MTFDEMHLIAEDLRKTAVNLQMFLDELIRDDRSLLADVLRKFPAMIEDSANLLYPRDMPLPPQWGPREAPAEEHYETLIARLSFWQAALIEQKKPT